MLSASAQRGCVVRRAPSTAAVAPRRIGGGRPAARSSSQVRGRACNVGGRPPPTARCALARPCAAARFSGAAGRPAGRAARSTATVPQPMASRGRPRRRARRAGGRWATAGVPRGWWRPARGRGGGAPGAARRAAAAAAARAPPPHARHPTPPAPPQHAAPPPPPHPAQPARAAAVDAGEAELNYKTRQYDPRELSSAEQDPEMLALPAGYHWYETMLVLRGTLGDEERCAGARGGGGGGAGGGFLHAAGRAPASTAARPLKDSLTAAHPARPPPPPPPATRSSPSSRRS